jgi:hypothetical protein
MRHLEDNMRQRRFLNGHYRLAPDIELSFPSCAGSNAGTASIAG